MKRPSNTNKHLAQRILSGALSLTLLLTGLVFAPIPVRAAGTATTYYEYNATSNPDADFAELQPNLTVGALAGTYANVRETQNGTFYFADGGADHVTLFKLMNNVGTRSAESGALTNKEQVKDPAYHYGLKEYRTYSSNDLYTKIDNPTYYKVPTVNLEIVPKSFQPLDTNTVGAANLSLIIACPVGANVLNVAFDRRMQVKVSLDGTNWLSGKAEIRSCEFLAGGKIGTTDMQLFRVETGDLLSISGVEGNTIKAVKVLPEGEWDCSRGYFYINRLLVNTYASEDDFNTLCPEEVIATTQYSSGDELRKIAVAEALRTVQTRWTTDEDIITVSPIGSSAVDSTNEAKTYAAKNFFLTCYYRAPVYDRETDVSREQFWSQFDSYSTTNHSITVTLPNQGSQTITVAAPNDANYTAEDMVLKKEYKNYDSSGNVSETLTSNQPYGMDCQTFVFNAISRVSRTSAVGAATTFGATRTRIVGGLSTRTHPIYSDADIANVNTAQKMYESYAAAKPGDILVHNLSNPICSVHTRLVRSVTVVRNNDGTIDPNQSIMYYLGQEGGSLHDLDDGLSTPTYTTARANGSVTFANLLNVGKSNVGSYVVYTLDEYQDGVVDNANVQLVAGSKHPNSHFADGGLNLSINSNYRIIRQQVQLQNASGTVLFDSGVEYPPLNPCAVGVNYQNAQLDSLLRKLPNGSYKLVANVHSGPFSDYTQVEPPIQTKEIAFTVSHRNIPCTGSHSGTSLGAAGSLSNGSYVLSGDISGTITVPAGVTATLCLNGHTLTAPADGFAIRVLGILNLCSCGVTGGTITGASTMPLINIESGATFNLYHGVTVTNTGAGDGSRGVANSGTVNMYGGLITGNTPTGNGGGVYMTSGTFHMSGGVICGNRAAQGGGVYANSGTVNISDTALICENKASGGDPVGGGGIFMYTGTLNMSDGVISENTANVGSGVYIRAGAKLNMTAGTIKGGNNLVYVLTSAEAGSTISGGKIICPENTAVITAAANRKVTLSGDTVVTGNVVSHGNVVIDGAFVNESVTAKTYTSGGTTTPGTVEINSGTVAGTLSTVTTSDITGIITVTGGKFSEKMADTLLNFIPNDTPYWVEDIDEAELKYEVHKGFYCSGAVIDFGSSLNVSLPLFSDTVPFDKTYTVELNTTKYQPVFEKVTAEEGLLPLYTLTIPGIAAKEMHDEITVTVSKDGTEYYKDTLSVYELAKEWAADTNNPEMKTMLADMINYGIEAQKAFGYNADDTAPLTVSGTFGSPNWTTTPGAGVSDESQRNNVALTLSLKEKIQLNVYINDPNAEIANVKFGAEDCIPGVDYTVENSTITRVNFHNIDIAHAKNPVEFTVTKGGDTFTVKYGIADYVLAALENGTEQADLLVALQKYVDSVHEYLTFGVDWITPDKGNSETNSQGMPGIAG